MRNVSVHYISAAASRVLSWEEAHEEALSEALAGRVAEISSTTWSEDVIHYGRTIARIAPPEQLTTEEN